MCFFINILQFVAYLFGIAHVKMATYLIDLQYQRPILHKIFKALSVASTKLYL